MSLSQTEATQGSEAATVHLDDREEEVTQNSRFRATWKKGGTGSPVFFGQTQQQPAGMRAWEVQRGRSPSLWSGAGYRKGEKHLGTDRPRSREAGSLWRESYIISLSYRMQTDIDEKVGKLRTVGHICHQLLWKCFIKTNLGPFLQVLIVFGHFNLKWHRWIVEKECMHQSLVYLLTSTFIEKVCYCIY